MLTNLPEGESIRHLFLQGQKHEELIEAQTNF